MTCLANLEGKLILLLTQAFQRVFNKKGSYEVAVHNGADDRAADHEE